ncbi:hypothetical protein [Streptomyces winkii]|uniref:hypothetical protein n=1 Tax=Streptomyces winkii TaxID=3051178 RepID=UPI0028D2CD7D|nr:hypothetical protein [Streptomyces sp. DSM 40971]
MPRRGSSRKAALCAPVLALALLTGLTGCGGEDGKSPGGESRSPGSAKGEGKGKGSRSASPSHPKSGKPSASSSRPSSGLPEAADGTDTGACDDGECQVELSKGDELHPESSYGIDEFTVHDIKDHVITWTALFSGGQVSMSSQGAEQSSTRCTNGSCSGHLGKSKGKIQMNRLTVEFEAIGEDRAVARLSHK